MAGHQFGRVTPGDAGQILGVDLDHGQVSEFVGANHLGGKGPAVMHGYPDLHRAIDHVIIGNDVSVRRDDDTAADAVLDLPWALALLRPLLAESVAGTRSEELGEGIVSLVLALTLRLCILLVGVGRHSDVDHRRCDLRGNRFDSLVKRKERRNAVVA